MEEPVIDEPSAHEMGSLRSLPASVELERTFLAQIIDAEGRGLEPTNDVRRYVRHPFVFSLRNHQMLYLACLDVYEAERTLSPAAVIERLSTLRMDVMAQRLGVMERMLGTGELDKITATGIAAMYKFRDEDIASGDQRHALAGIGGYSAVAELWSRGRERIHMHRVAQRLQYYYLRRRIIVVADRLARVGAGEYAFDDVVALSSEYLMGLSTGLITQDVVTASTAKNEFLDRVVNAANHDEVRIQTGYAEIDRTLTALRPGGLYILAARPGVGKTSFALSMVQNICGTNQMADASGQRPGVLFFSLEVDRADLVKKLLCNEAEVSFRQMEKTGLSAVEWQRLEDSQARFREWNLKLVDVSDLTVQALRSIINRHCLDPDANLKAVVIDYLQLLGSATPGQSEYEKVSEISRLLKIIAREVRIPIIALSQMSRDSEKGGKGPRVPRLADLRGSGSIEQDADAVMFLHRVHEDDTEKDKSVREVLFCIAKNRFGPADDVEMKFYPERQKFEVAPHVLLQKGHQASDSAGGGGGHAGGAPSTLVDDFEVRSGPSTNGRRDQPPGDDEDLFA